MSVFSPVFGQKKDAKGTTPAPLFESSTLGGLNFRMVGPALTSGRVIDIAVNPKNPDNWFIAAACGGVWTTTNHGTTFSPVFDNKLFFDIPSSLFVHSVSKQCIKRFLFLKPFHSLSNQLILSNIHLSGKNYLCDKCISSNEVYYFICEAHLPYECAPLSGPLF